MTGGEIGYEFVAPVKALSPLELEDKRDGVREVLGIGGGKADWLFKRVGVFQ
jgi:hypothetical protein